MASRGVDLTGTVTNEVAPWLLFEGILAGIGGPGSFSTGLVTWRE